jgi:toxin-antitoxin system PIN domain toxin
MILPDLNLLLYAYNGQVPQHEAARAWWESAINGRELIGLPHEVSLGFVRIATNPRLGACAVSLAVARSVVESWLEASPVRILLPTEDHAIKVCDLMESSRCSGALASDASLAVYAIENRAVLCSNDADFTRFPGLDWRNPLYSG